MKFITRLRRTPLLLAAVLAVGAVCLPGCGSNNSSTGPTPSATTYALTVVSEGEGATPNGVRAAGVTVSIYAGKAPAGKEFFRWTTSNDGVTFNDKLKDSTYFTMPANAVTVTAEFVPEGEKPKAYTVTVLPAGGLGGGSYVQNDTVKIKAAAAPDDSVFDRWTETTNNGVTFAKADNAETWFIMPADSVTVRATYKQPPPTYTVTIVSDGAGYSGHGKYEAEAEVVIFAGTAPTGQRFIRWTTTSSGVLLINQNNATTKFFMPANDVTVTAVFDAAPPIVPFKTAEMPGGLTWSAENLNLEAAAGNSWCYDDDEANCDIYGKLYDWEAAMAVCPTGWRLPTNQEWKNMVAEAEVRSHPAARALKDSVYWNDNGNGFNYYGFSARPGGMDSSGYFVDIGNYGHWWTSTEYSGGSAPRAHAWFIASKPTPDINIPEVGEIDEQYPNNPSSVWTLKSNGYSVRCVQTLFRVTVSSVSNEGVVGSGDYVPNARVNIAAGKAPAGKRFKEWTSEDDVIFNNATRDTTYFTMPDKDVTVTATFEDLPLP